jgi:hypothetical protein
LHLPGSVLYRESVREFAWLILAPYGSFALRNERCAVKSLGIVK